MIYLIKILQSNYQITPSSLSSIGLFIVVNDDIKNKYDSHIASLACYAYRHSYHFILIHQKQYPTCINLTRSIYFQKHCFVSKYLLENIHIQWLLVLDVDVLVLNISKKIESYLPNSSNKSSIYMILSEKFNGEIAAGNYLIRNHPWSQMFLLRWILYERRSAHFKFHNNDNGALHLHLLGDMVGNTSRSIFKHCFQIYKKAIDPNSYHTYVGCCKCALNGRWEFEHLRILRRGHSFVRDNLGYDMNKRIWSPTDFLIHGQKENVGAYYSKDIDTYKCMNSKWILPIKQDVIMRNYNEVKDTIKKFDQEAAAAYPQSVGIADISECWPYCVDNETRRAAFVEKVCNNNAAWKSL